MTAPVAATVRYWAAAKSAAGLGADVVEAATLHDALEAVRARHDERFAQVLTRCSLLVDGDPVGTREHHAISLSAGSLIDCLPPFAGG